MMNNQPQADTREIELSVIIPAYNEEARIAATISRVSDFLCGKGCAYEIIVVDDASRDGTCSQVERLFSRGNIRLIKNLSNMGKGFAVRRGILSAAGRYILFTDADLSTPIEEVKKLIAALHRGYDIAIASRALDDSRIIVRQPWYRERMGKTFNLFVRTLVIGGIKDTQCGFKLFKSEAAKAVFAIARIDRFAFDAEALFIAKKLGYRIKDIPVAWKNSNCSKVHIFTDSARMLIDLARILAYEAAGEYKVLR